MKMITKHELQCLVESLMVELSMKRLIIAGNWKMNMTLAQASAFLDGLPGVATGSRLVLFPPATLLFPLSARLREMGIVFGPQNVHHKQSGAFTGEISIPMIQEIGCGAALIGHSERRLLFGETDADIALKTAALLEAGITTLICIGETLEQRRAERWKAILETQVLGALKDLPPRRISNIMLAYEPVWAIGTGLTAGVQEIEDAHRHIKSVVKASFGADVSVLYGGSVNEKNAANIGSIAEVDGFLIGGASLNASSFSKIITDSHRVSI